MGLIAMARQGVIAILAGRAGRYYGDGLRWALSLPVPELLFWNRLIGDIDKTERGQ